MNGGTATQMTFGVLILGAGRSIRMGRPKLVLPWGDTTIIGRLVSQWVELGARQVAIVCAAGNKELEKELDRISFGASNRIQNPAPERGMFSSIQCAASWNGWVPELTHWVIVLGDQPHLKSRTLGRLLQFAGRHGGQVCQPEFMGRARHPVVMPRSIFLALAESSAPNLKEFLLPHQRVLYGAGDPGLAVDIDNPEDYQRALDLWGRNH